MSLLHKLLGLGGGREALRKAVAPTAELLETRMMLTACMIDGTGSADTILVYVDTVSGIVKYKLNGGAEQSTGIAYSLIDLTVNGAGGNDTIEIQKQASLPLDAAHLNGGDGNDTIKPGFGDETIQGGAGTDLLDYSGRTTGVRIYLDSADGDSGEDGVDSHRIANGEVENAKGGSGEDWIYGNSGANVLWGLGGNDVISGDDGGDVIYGGGDDDALFGEGGYDGLWGESGDDSLYGGAGNDYMYGGYGEDYLEGGDGNDYMMGNEDNDTVSAADGYRDTFLGGTGADVVWSQDAFDEIML